MTSRPVYYHIQDNMVTLVVALIVHLLSATVYLFSTKQFVSIFHLFESFVPSQSVSCSVCPLPSACFHAERDTECSIEFAIA